MSKKLSRNRAELFRIVYVLIWTVLIAISLLLSTILGDHGQSEYFENKYLLPLLIAVVLFLTELCYTFLDEKLRDAYSHVFGVMVCITLFFALLFSLILAKGNVWLEYLFIALNFATLGCIKWFKTPLLPHKKNGAIRIKATRVDTTLPAARS